MPAKTIDSFQGFLQDEWIFKDKTGKLRLNCKVGLLQFKDLSIESLEWVCSVLTCATFWVMDLWNIMAAAPVTF